MKTLEEEKLDALERLLVEMAWVLAKANIQADSRDLKKAIKTLPEWKRHKLVKDISEGRSVVS